MTRQGTAGFVRMYSRKWKSVFVSVLLMAVLGFSGCSSGKSSGESGGPSESPPSIGEIHVVTESVQARTPIDDYLLSSQDLLKIQAAQDALISRCLAVKGHAATISESDDLPAFVDGVIADRIARSDLWGFFDPVNAAKYGYGRPPTVPGHTSMPNPRGVPVDVYLKCRSESLASFMPDFTVSYGGPKVLPDGGPQSALTDSRYTSVVGQWSSCMRGKGFNYASPLDALSDQRWVKDSSSPAEKQVEITTAVADLACKAQVNLIGTAVAVQTAYDNRYIAAHSRDLASFRASIDAYIRSAAK